MNTTIIAFCVLAAASVLDIVLFFHVARSLRARLDELESHPPEVSDRETAAIASMKTTLDYMMRLNEQLILLVGVKENGSDAGRALVALHREPNKETPSTAVKTEPDKKPFTMTVGSI